MIFLHPFTVHALPPLDWKTLNPNLKDAVLVENSSQCLDCHADYIRAFQKTHHARAYQSLYGWKGARTCEACHGPLSKHLATKDLGKKPETVVSFSRITPQQKIRICLQCHEKNVNMNWRGSPHDMANVSCDKCHYVMARKSRQALVILEDSKRVCFQCHKDKRALIQRSAHMPLRENKMSCTSCHNPHGGPGPHQLKKPSVNETCYICHQEKRGPMLWEHAPVRENCTTCHQPHGSNHRALLKQKVPFLCQTCHMAAFHPSTLYDGTNLPGGAGTSSRGLLGKACLNCHSRIHGSNHPSGSHLTR